MTEINIEQDKEIYFEYGGKKFTIKLDINGNYGHFSSDRYQTFLNHIRSNNISQMEIKAAICELFSKVPQYILDKIVEIIQNPDHKLICIRMRKNTDELMKISSDISDKTGWYYYITGNSLDIPHDMCLDLKNIERNHIPKILFNDLKDKEINPNDLTITTLVDSQPYHCIEVKILNHTILLDCGFVVHDGDPKPSLDKNQSLLSIQNYLKKQSIEYVFITHVHDDHISGLKWLLDRGIVGIIGTKTTLLSIRNKFQKEKFLNLFLDHAYPAKYEQRIALTKNCKMILYPAGHVPGNASIIIEIIQRIPKKPSDPNSKKEQKEWRFLYSSDLLLDDLPPIDGFDYFLRRFTQKKRISLGIIDGSRHNINMIPLHNQLNALYQEAEITLNKGRSVIIATEPYSLAILIYLYFYDKDRENNKKIQVPIYVEKVIYDHFCVLKLCAEDLTNNIKSRIIGKRNPYESWRIVELPNKNKDDIYSILEALKKPSIILTYPTTINEDPLKSLYKNIECNSSHLLVFASYLKQPLEVQFKKDPPNCEIFNLKPAYKDYEFQNHGDQSQIDKIRNNLTIDRVILFHLPDFKTFEKLHPTENSI